MYEFSGDMAIAFIKEVLNLKKKNVANYSSKETKKCSKCQNNILLITTFRCLY